MKKYVGVISICLFRIIGLGWASASSGDITAAKAAKLKCKNSSLNTDSACSKSYSCDSLFESEHNKAIKCNWDRCINEKGEDTKAEPDGYCNCKYGNNWDWKSIWIPLNTSIPFIGKCSGRATNESDSALSAFPAIIQAASRMLVTVILLFGFIMVVVGWVQRSSGNAWSPDHR